MSTRIHLRTLALLLGLTGLLSACGEDLPKATLITHLRLLGAHIAVKGDETRSSPKPGETATVSYAMVFPSVEQDDSELSSLFISCTAPTTFTGIPICQEFIDAAQASATAAAPATSEPVPSRLSCKGFENNSFPAAPGVVGTCVTGAPKLDVAIEPKSKIERKLVRGIVCRNGTPAFVPDNPQLFECDKNPGAKAKDVEEITILSTVGVQHDAASTNESPSWADGTLERGTKAWDADAVLPATDDDCLDAAKADMLALSDGRGEEINLSFASSAREKLEDGDPELLELSAFATAGEIERRFVVFDTDAKVVKGQLEGDWAWKMSQAERNAIGKNGKLVRFFFTVLDRRGGFDITTRSLCVQH